jgi:uncharacterized Zn-binding protein involved in type VI secretion
MAWSPPNDLPVISTQEDSQNDSVTVSFTLEDGSGGTTPIVDPVWSWNPDQLPSQVTFTPSPGGTSATVFAPNWLGLFPVSIDYRKNGVLYNVSSWGDVPSDGLVVNFDASSLSLKTFTFTVSVSYRTMVGGPISTASQSYQIEVFSNYDVGKSSLAAANAGKAGLPVAKLGGNCTGHGCFPPRNSTSAEANVLINGVGVVTLGDTWGPHTCGKNTHAGTQSAGSPTVFVNGAALARVGDAISCGSAVAEGATFVFSG